jgi:hypothetical protein
LILARATQARLNLCLLDLTFRLCNPALPTRANAVPHLVHNEQTKLFAGMLDRVATVCLAVGVATPISAFVIGPPQAPMANLPWLIGSGAVWSDVYCPTSGGTERFGGLARMTALQLFVLFGLPLLIGIAGVLAAASFRRRNARNRAQTSPS